MDPEELSLPISRRTWIVAVCLAALLCAALAMPESDVLLATLSPIWLFITILILAPLSGKPEQFVPSQSPFLPTRSPRPPPLQ